MEAWFVYSTIIIFVAVSVVTNLLFRHVTEREVVRHEDWPAWTRDEQLEHLRDLNETSTRQTVKIWRNGTVFLIMVLWFVPNALWQSAEAADDARQAAEAIRPLVEDVAHAQEDIERILANTEYESCVNANENRLYNQSQKEIELDQAERDLASVKATPPIDITALPGYNAIRDQPVRRIIDSFGVLIVAARDANILQFEAEVDRLETDLEMYKDQFPLRQCGDDPIPTTTTTTSTTTTSTTTTSTTTTSTTTTSTTTTVPPTTTTIRVIVPTTVRPIIPTTTRPPVVTSVPPTRPPSTTTTTVPPTTTTIDCPGNSQNCNRPGHGRPRP